MPSDVSRSERARERIADRASISEGVRQIDADRRRGPFLSADDGGRTPVGVLGIPEPAAPLSDGRRRLAMAAALLAISLRNAQLFHEVRENSLRDGLTGCFNRTHAIAVIDMELRRARRSRLPVSLIMLDIDHFKEVNDRYGHLCGDAVHAAIGARMREGAARQRLRNAVWRRRVPRAAAGNADRGREARRRHAVPRAGESADPVWKDDAASSP